MKCIYINDNNKKCNAYSQKGKDYCFRHDPTKREESRLASSKGGSNRALQGFYGNPVKLETPEDVKIFLSKVISGVWSEGIPVQVGSSMGFLTRCWLDAYEVSDVEKRLNEVEIKIESYLRKSTKS